MPRQTSIEILKTCLSCLQPSVMLKIWTEEFLSVSIADKMHCHCVNITRIYIHEVYFPQTILRLDPKFIALHCQEVGGKHYEESMRHVEDFVR